MKRLADVVWIDPRRMSGAPVFPHTRITVDTLFNYLRHGASVKEFVDDFDIEEEVVMSFLAYLEEQFGGPSDYRVPEGAEVIHARTD